MSTQQPRPVINAFRWVVAMQMVIGPGIALLRIFEMVVWTADQMAQVNAFAAVVVGAVAYGLGLRAEAEVTPVASPRNNEGETLAPIARPPSV
jgi:hypothetical protein